MKKISCVALFCLLVYTSAFATIRLPTVISSNMVLQQRSTAAIWGWGDPGEKLSVTTSWNKVTDSLTVPSDGRWKIKLPTTAAGGPYTITLQGWNRIVLDNILLGEVWLCSGQSNMEWSSYNNNQQIIDELPKSTNNQIRLFHIARTTADYPQDNCEARWEICGPETLKGFSAVGYFFGKKLQRELNVPIGLIEAAWGGTHVESWTPAPVIAGDPVLQTAAARLPATIWGPHLPGVLYNAMIAPVTSFAIAGAIWYQGESNTGTAASYQATFTAMIEGWRNGFDRNFPFYYVQIAPYNYGNNNQGALLQEQQTRTQSLPGTGMVVVTDLVDNVNDIHPQNKYDVGERLAGWALGATYSRQVAAYKNPVLKTATPEKNTIILSFDHAPNGLVTKEGKPATEFYIAGGDQVFLPADTRIEANRIIVSHKKIANPVAVRFGFSNTARPNLFSKEGLPVTPFRTDNWDAVLSTP